MRKDYNKRCLGNQKRKEVCFPWKKKNKKCLINYINHKKFNNKHSMHSKIYLVCHQMTSIYNINMYYLKFSKIIRQHHIIKLLKLKITSNNIYLININSFKLIQLPPLMVIMLFLVIIIIYLMINLYINNKNNNKMNQKIIKNKIKINKINNLFNSKKNNKIIII